MTHIRTFSRRVSTRLLAWSAFSMAAGAVWLRGNSRLGRGLGLHFLVWGAVDALIALGGLLGAARRKRQEKGEASPETLAAEKSTLSRLLWLNSGLDCLYLAGGWWLLTGRGQADDHWRGQGIGVLIQGGFLLLFDLWHALRLGRLPR